MLQLISIGITGFVISFLGLPIVIRYTLKQNLVDVPGKRKIHKKRMPSMGGVPIFLGFILSSLIWIDFQYWYQLKYIFSAAFIVFIVGFRDDLVPMKVSLKILGQFLACSILVLLLELNLQGLYGLLGIVDFPHIVNQGITIFTIIIIMNAFNLIDGMDGLASTLSLLSLLWFGIWFFVTGNSFYSFLALSLAGAIFAFLIFNWEPAEIFMGDTGALLIGIMMAIFSIAFMRDNFALPPTSFFKFKGTISAGMAIIIIPLLDTARIIALRLWKRKSPFKADKSHMHHALLRLGLSHGKSVFILGGIQLAFFFLIVLLKDLPDSQLLPIMAILAISISVFFDQMVLQRLIKKKP